MVELDRKIGAHHACCWQASRPEMVRWLFVVREDKETLMNDPMTEPMTGEEGDGGFTVCLHVSADGQLSVSVERGEAEESAATPVKGLQQAVEMIVAAVKNGGQQSDQEAQGEFDRAYSPQQQSPAKRFA